MNQVKAHFQMIYGANSIFKENVCLFLISQLICMKEWIKISRCLPHSHYAIVIIEQMRQNKLHK